MIRQHRVSPLRTAVVWILVLLMVEPQSRIVGQESSTFIRTLEVLLTPSLTSIAGSTALFLTAAAESGRPSLAPITNQTINVGQRLSVTVRATDPDLPAQTLQFTLLEKPDGATVRKVRGTNAVIGWIPSRDSADTTNLFTVVVTDNGTPSLSATQSFQVIVTDFAQSALGTTIIQAGQDGCLPLTIDSSETITNVEMTIAWPLGTFTNFTVTPTAPQICSATLQPISPTKAVVRLFTCPGQALTLTQAVDLADLCFTALPGQASAFVPLVITNSTVRTLSGIQLTNRAALAGRVVVVGSNPLLEITRTDDGQRQLFLYATPGRFYQIDSTTNLSDSAAWQLACRVPMTGPALVLCCVDLTGPSKFFRAFELGAGPTNESPRVDAGPDQILSTNLTTLRGTASDDGLPAGCKPLTYAWTRVSGPGPVSFSNPTSLVTTVSFDVRGIYVFRLAVSDSQATNSDDVTISAPAFNCALTEAEGWVAHISNPLPAASAGSVQFTNCTIVLNEGGSFEVAAEKTFQIPPTPSMLVVTYETPAFDSTSTGLMRDAFEVALLDNADRPLTYTIQDNAGLAPTYTTTPSVLQPSPDALFNHTEGKPPFAAPGSVITPTPGSDQQLSIDVSHLSPESSARLLLRLVNNDRDRAMAVRITDVRFEAASLGAQVALPAARSPLVAADASRLTLLKSPMPNLQSPAAAHSSAAAVQGVTGPADPTFQLASASASPLDTEVFTNFFPTVGCAGIHSIVTNPPMPLVAAGFQIEVFAEVPSPACLAFAPPGSPFGPDLFVGGGQYQSTEDPAQQIGNDFVVRISSSGVVTPFAILLPEADPGSLAFPLRDGPFGDFLYVSSNNRDGGKPLDQGGTVQRINPAGNVTDFTPVGLPNGPGEPAGIAFAPGGIWGTDLYVANSSDDPGDILKVNPAGTVSTFVHDGKFSFCSQNGFAPSLLAFGRGGAFGSDMFFSDSGEGCNCIRRAAPDGSVSIPWITLPGVPASLKFGPGGVLGQDLYVGILTTNANSTGTSISISGSILRVKADGSMSVFASGLVGLSTTMEFSTDGAALFIGDFVRNRIYRITPALPRIAISSPPDSAEFVAGNAVLVSGQAQAPSNGNSIQLVTVNGSSVDTLDAAGNFFSRVVIGPGPNAFEFTATDALGQTVTTSLTLQGVQRSPGQIDLSTLSDVSTSLVGEYGRTSFNKHDNTLFAEVAVRNVGQYSVRTPLLVGISHISDPSVRPLSPDGVSADGTPYYDFTATIGDGTLSPADIAPLTPLPEPALGFSRNGNSLVLSWPTSVTHGVLQQTSMLDPRWIWTDIFTLTGATNQFRVQIGAGAKAFRLQIAEPSSLSRTIAFSNPNRVQFSYDLVVLGQLNRAPAFTSTPNLEALTGKLYEYAPTAVDPDGDLVTFSLPSAPRSMTINALTGQISWIPTAGDVGPQNIMVRVQDGRGGVAGQNYVLSLISPPPNRPPYFISTPVVEARIDVPYTYDAAAKDPDSDPVTYSLLAGPATMTIDSMTGRIRWVSTTQDSNDTNRTIRLNVVGLTVEVYASLPEPTQLAFDSAGNLYVGRNEPSPGFTNSLSIRRIPFASRIVSDYGPPTPDPDTVLFDSLGTISSVQGSVLVGGSLFSPQYPGVVWAIFPDQTTNRLFGPSNTLGNVSSMRFDSTGRLLFVNRDNGDVLVSTGNFPTVLFHAANDGSTIAIGSTDRIYHSGRDGTIRVYDSNGTLVNNAFSTGLGPVPPLGVGPGGMWANDLYTVRQDGGQLLRISEQGAITVLGDGFTNIQDIAFGPDGAMYVSDYDGGRVLRIGPTESNVHVSIQASDGHGGIASQSFIITVLPDTANHPPVIISQPVTSVGAGQQYRYLIRAIDPDEDTLAYSLVNPRSGIGIEPTTGMITWNVPPAFRTHIDPRATFLRTCSDTVPDAIPISLSDIGLLPGDTVFLRNTGTWIFTSEGDVSSGLWGVFSGSDILLPASQQARVRDAIGMDISGGLSGRTYFCATPIDVPEAFFISTNAPVKVRVPTGATHLFVATVDSFYTDNSDPGTNLFFGISIAEQKISLRADDEHGGNDTQEFLVRVEDQVTAEIHGIVFNDLNGNGERDTGDLIIASAKNARVLRYDRNSGTPLGVFAQAPALDNPEGMTWGPDGRLYVISQGNDSILRFDGNNGTFIDSFVPRGYGGLSSPHGIHYGCDGNIYVGSRGNNRVLRYSGQTGGFLGIAANLPNRPLQCFLDPDGNLYVSSSDNTIRRYNPTNGAEIDVFVTPGSGGLIEPHDFVFGPDGDLYTTSYTHEVLQYDGKTGAFKSVLVAARNGGLDTPVALIFTPEGGLLVSSYGNDKILRYSASTGSFLNTFATNQSGGLSGPDFMAFNFEPGMQGWVVYLDDNRNGRLDAGERFTISEGCVSGAYSFENLAPRTYAVVEQPLPGWRLTTLSNLTNLITITNGQVLTGVDFGNQQFEEPHANRSPVFVSSAKTNATVGQDFLYDADSIDPEGDPLTFDLTLKPSGMTVEPASGMVVWTPRSEQVGPHDVVLRVNDGRGGLDLQAFRITVSPPDTPPVITSQPSMPAVVNVPYQYQVRAQDAEQDTLSFALSSAPTGMVISATSGLLTWLPASSHVGTQQVAVTVSDGRGGFASQAFDLPVVALLSNNSPVIISQPVTSIVPGETYSYDVDAIDPDANSLTYSLLQSPEGMSIDSTNGLIQWQPGTNFLTTNVVTFFDGDLNHADLEVSTMQLGNGGSYSFSQSPTGGNPGAFGQFGVTANSSPPHGQSAVLLFARRIEAVYDTASRGGLFSIDYSASERIEASGGPVTGLGLRQGGRLFVAMYQPETLVGWKTNRLSNFSAVDFNEVQLRGPYDFTDEGSHPDFSATGAPLEMGFIVLVYSGIDTGGVGTPYEIDNWRVDLHPAQAIPVSVEVEDSAGGLAIQDFTLRQNQPGELHGFAFSDLNRSGSWNRSADLAVVAAAYPKSYYRFNSQSGALIERSSAIFYAVGPDGFLYGPKGTTIRKYDPQSGQPVAIFATNFSGISFGMAFGPDGNLYVSDLVSDSVLRFDGLSGQLLGTFVSGGGLDSPNAITFGRNGQMYVTAGFTGGGALFCSDGSSLRSFSDGRYQSPIGMTLGPDGRLYSASFWTGNVLAFDVTNGVFQTEFVPASRNGGLLYATSLAFGPDGNLYVSSSTLNAIFRYNGTNGEFMDRFIQGGNQFVANYITFLQITERAANGAPEPGLSDWTVYLDQNRNGRRDAGEQFTRTDPNGQYAFTNLPGGTHFVREEPQAGWLQTAPSNQQHIVTVANGQVVYNIDFGNVTDTNTFTNFPPSFVSTPPTNATVGALYRYDSLAVDPNSDPLTYTLTTSPAGMTVDPLVGTIVWSPQANQNGSFDVALRASDGRGGFATQSFQMTVTRGNTSPAIVSVASQQARAGTPYSYQVLVTDLDGDSIAFSLLGHPAGMAISSSGLVTWTPTTVQIGTKAVTVQVDDGHGGITSQSFAVRVRLPGANTLPVITSIPRFAATFNRAYAYDAAATDADGDVLTWFLESGPAGMSIDPTLGTVRWTPAASQLGTSQVSIRVLDGQGGTSVQAYEVIVRAANLPPSIVSIPPTTAVINRLYTYALHPSDPENDPLALSLAIAPTNMTLNVTNGVIQWIPNASQVGPQNIEVRVEDLFGGVGNQTFTIVVATNENRYPVINSTPAFQGIANQPYRYQLVASDPDGDPLSYALLNGPAGMTISANSGLVSWLPTVAQVGRSLVTVAAVDASGASGRQSFSIDIALANTPPQITSDNPTEIAVVGLPYRYDVRALDADGDSVTYRLVSAPPGMVIDGLGRVSWVPVLADVGTNLVEIQVLDVHGAAQNQAYAVLVLPDTTIPLVGLSIGPNPALLNSRVFFNVRASDQSGQPALGLTLDGVPLILDATGGANFFATHAGLFSVVASATDAAGNISSRTNILQVIDPSNTNAPVVYITSPTNDAMLTSGVDIIGSVQDDDLVSYTLSVSPAAGGDFKEIGHGLTTVTNGVLGRFDPATLNNDSYVLVLSATDAAGHIADTRVMVHVAGDLKLGNFRLSFTDLTIPVGGIPITISRTYDTMNSATAGDFGYGWRLEFRETALRSSVPNFANAFDAATLNYIPFRYGTRVYTTLPGGRRQGFTFRPVPRYGFFGVYLYKPAFVADSGVTSELRVPDSDQHLLFADPVTGDFLDYGSSRPYNPANSDLGANYTLTSKEGIRYEISSLDGKLSSLVDPNTNRLTFTSSGITSSSGAQVLFTRDPQGRITAVTDPMGKQVHYAYDVRGDLVGVTDRETNTTRFVYYATPAHYLKEVVDPLGRSGVRANYDAQGLLAGLVDAVSNTVQIIHDPANFVEKVVDTLGNTNTYEYDDRGNVVTEVNALGAITRRGYDLNNNMLTEVDPLGNTNRFEYDGVGNVLTRTDAAGNLTRFTYNSMAQVVSTTDPLGNTTLNEYDSRGNLLSTTDPAGNISRYTYDGAGNATSIKDAAGSVTQFDYDDAGHLMRQIDALGNATSFTYDNNGNQTEQTTTVTTPAGSRILTTRTTYDASGRPTSVTNPEGNITRTEYDAVGNTIATVDALNHRTQFRYDDRGKFVQNIFADGASNSIAYNAAGHRISSTDRAGRTTYYEYDPLGRLVATVYPDDTPGDLSDNPRVRTVYDLAGRVCAQIDERTNRTEFSYDNLGRQIRVRDALSNETWTAYDPAGRQIATTNALGRVTQFVYDALGRRAETILADNTRRRTVYDTLGRVMAEVDQAGVTNRFEYDALGRLTNVVDALGHSTAYAYNEAGNLIRQQDANNHVTRYEYDGLGRRISTILPLGQRSGTLYDPLGNVAASTNFNGQIITYEYDANNRLARKILPLLGERAGVRVDQTNTYTYTPRGRRESITDARGVTMFAYDSRDRLLFRTDPDGHFIRYTYDVAGNRAAVITASGTNRFTFDALNRLETVTDPDGGVARYSYDRVNNVVLMTLPNGTVRTNVYDDLSRLTYLEHRNSTSVIASYRYTLGPTGNRVAVQEHDGRQVRYDYDALYRLVRERVSRDPIGPNPTNSYVYDPVGNRLFFTNSLEGVTAYAYDDNDQLLAETLNTQLSTLNTAYTYDANGNTLSRSNAIEQAFYGWSAENRLITATVNGTNSTHQQAYQYDDDGIRVAAFVDADETRYLIDANRPFAQVVEEYAPNGVVRAIYTHGPHHLISQSRASARSWYHADGLGSTRALTSLNGNPTDRYHFDAYGRTLAQSGPTENSYLFVGEQRDGALDLDFLRARYMDFKVGRFISRDLLEGREELPITHNKYVYANAHPTDYVDASGYWASRFGFFVHQHAIDDALSFLPERERAILKEQQPIMDLAQDSDDSYLHAMRPPDRPGQNEQLAIALARERSDTWVRSQMEFARSLNRSGRRDEALTSFGSALHTLQDATSPSHVGFQVWDGNWRIGSGPWDCHVSHELVYPGNGSELYRMTMQAYNYFADDAPLPSDFFLAPIQVAPGPCGQLNSAFRLSTTVLGYQIELTDTFVGLPLVQ